MQNAVNQNIRTLTIFLQSTTSYLFRFGNYRGNGLVTEILLYLAISCFLTKQQIRAFQLIINELRFIRCVSLVTVSLVITHTARHTFTTMMLTLGADLYTTSKLLGHADVKMTQVYAKIINQKKDDAVNLVNGLFD